MKKFLNPQKGNILASVSSKSIMHHKNSKATYENEEAMPLQIRVPEIRTIDNSHETEKLREYLTKLNLQKQKLKLKIKLNSKAESNNSNNLKFHKKNFTYDDNGKILFVSSPKLPTIIQPLRYTIKKLRGQSNNDNSSDILNKINFQKLIKDQKKFNDDSSDEDLFFEKNPNNFDLIRPSDGVTIKGNGKVKTKNSFALLANQEELEALKKLKRQYNLPTYYKFSKILKSIKSKNTNNPNLNGEKIINTGNTLNLTEFEPYFFDEGKNSCVNFPQINSSRIIKNQSIQSISQNSEFSNIPSSMKFIDSQAVLVPFQKQLKKPRISDIVKLKELSIGTFK